MKHLPEGTRALAVLQTGACNNSRVSLSEQMNVTTVVLLNQTDCQHRHTANKCKGSVKVRRVSYGIYSLVFMFSGQEFIYGSIDHEG